MMWVLQLQMIMICKTSTTKMWGDGVKTNDGQITIFFMPLWSGMEIGWYPIWYFFLCSFEGKDWEEGSVTTKYIFLMPWQKVIWEEGRLRTKIFFFDACHVSTCKLMTAFSSIYTLLKELLWVFAWILSKSGSIIEVFCTNWQFIFLYSRLKE